MAAEDGYIERENEQISKYIEDNRSKIMVARVKSVMLVLELLTSV